MKTKAEQILLRSFFLFIVLTSGALFNHSYATHLLGGEISWECLKSGNDAGKFVFTVKLYRLCSGSTFLSTPNITNPLASQGGPSTIPTSQKSTTAFNTSCHTAGQGLDCYQSSTWADVMEEKVFASDPIHLIGVPPATGALFTYITCCRPASTTLQNIIGNGSYYMRSIMYPYTNPFTGNPQPVGNSFSPTCYDSSPMFAEPPVFATCIGYTHTYDHHAIDLEYDSVVYDWASPMTSDTNTVIWTTGYADTAQLPTKVHDTNNVAATLNPWNGAVTFTSKSTSGVHVMCIKATAYRGGQKIAEAFRDVATKLMVCAPTPTFPPIINVPPILNYVDTGNSWTRSQYSDTVQLGQTVEFNIKGTDIQFRPGPASTLLPQYCSIEVSGAMMSSNLHDSTACSTPPCAYIDTSHSTITSGKVNDAYGAIARFRWTPGCNHLPAWNLFAAGQQPRYVTYHFSVDMRDDFCPVNGITNSIFSITVLDTASQTTTMTKMDAEHGGVKLEWTPYNVPGFTNYEIYRGDSAQSTYGLLTTINSAGSTTYHDLSAKSDSTPYFYYVNTNSSGLCEKNTIYKSVYLRIAENLGIPVLYWNHPYLDQTTFHQGQYEVFRKDQGSNWHPVDTLPYGIEYTHQTYGPYNKYTWFKVVATDGYGLTSISNLDSVKIDSVIVPPPPPPPPGVEELEQNLNVKLFPNPSNGLLQLSVNHRKGAQVYYQVYDLLGKEVFHSNWIMRSEEDTETIDLSALQPGQYLLRVNADGLTGSKNVILY